MADDNDNAALSATTLPLHADAAAFFVPPAPSLLLLAVATYELVADRNERLGGIHLFDASKGELTPLGGVGSGSSSGEGESAAAPRFPGVFDIKWMPVKDEEESRPTLGVALADGSVRLMEALIEAGGKSAVLRETARCFPLRVGGGEEGEAEEEEGEGAAPSLPSHPLDDPRAMALFLDFEKDSGGDGESSRIAVSFSDGRVAVLEATTTAASAGADSEPSSSPTTTGLEALALWRAHDAECWCVSFGGKSTLYTSADDCEFLAWDLGEIIFGGEEEKKKSKPRPAWRAGSGGEGEGRHSAGVCCIAPCPSLGCAAEGGDKLVATGSYDGRVRVWDVSRSPREPLFVCASAAEGEGAAAASSSPSSSSAPLGGGAWRLVWHPGGEPRLLCAAMHAGFAVLRLLTGGEGEEEEARLEVEQRYRGHGADPSPLNGGAATLGYGCDWAFFPADGESGGEKRLVAATASFYDNAVHLWEPRQRERFV